MALKRAGMTQLEMAGAAISERLACSSGMDLTLLPRFMGAESRRSAEYPFVTSHGEPNLPPILSQRSKRALQG
jgi:hypothetical protein